MGKIIRGIEIQFRRMVIREYSEYIGHALLLHDQQRPRLEVGRIVWNQTGAQQPNGRARSLKCRFLSL